MGACSLAQEQTKIPSASIETLRYLGFTHRRSDLPDDVAELMALGAPVIEKHLTLDCTLPGPDHRASLEPEEFAAMVRGIRSVEASLGHGRKEPSPSELDTAAVARKSLVAAMDISAGTTLTEEHIAVMRPGTGISPSELQSVIGATLEVTLAAGALLARDMLSGNGQERQQ